MLTDDLFTALRTLTADHSVENMFLLADENSQKFCLSQVTKVLNIPSSHIYIIKSGEEQKNFSTVQSVWKFLIENNANRQSLLLCLGGGVVTDLGAFVASTYMRGIEFVHIPTTLLAMVDASIGGKAGFDFMGIKNVIGVFRKPLKTIVFPDFLLTLPSRQLLSGYAEVLKHALIASPLELAEVLNFDLQSFKIADFIEILERSMAIKEYIVEQDPEEKNIRKALNFGHTIGHALESYFLSENKELLHGYAVAYGIVGALYLSVKKLNLNQAVLQQVISFVKQYYGTITCPCKDFEQILSFMRHDKKSVSSDEFRFALLRQVGNYQIDVPVSEEEVREALDFVFNM